MPRPLVSTVEAFYGDGTMYLIPYNGSPITSVAYPHKLWEYRTVFKSANDSLSVSASGWKHPKPFQSISSYRTPCGTQMGFAILRDDSKLVFEGGAGWNEAYFGLPSFPPNLEGAAVNKALSALKNQKVNLGVAFAERKETAELFLSVAKKISKQVEHYKSLSPKKWRKVLGEGKRGSSKDIPKDWLELQYGWKPLLSDVHGACQAIENKDRDGDAYRATVHGRVSSQISDSFIKTSDYSSAIYANCKVEGNHRCHCRLDYVLENPLLATLAQMGVTNPVEIVWERVPYSFVVDWFLPVGNYINLWDADLGWRFIGGSVGKLSKFKVSGPIVLNQDREPYWALQSSGHYVENGHNFERVVFSSSPSPRLPSFKQPLTSGHIANAMSLLVSAFSHK